MYMVARETACGYLANHCHTFNLLHPKPLNITPRNTTYHFVLGVSDMVRKTQPAFHAAFSVPLVVPVAFYLLIVSRLNWFMCYAAGARCGCGWA
jgi:hypothetical protein